MKIILLNRMNLNKDKDANKKKKKCLKLQYIIGSIQEEVPRVNDQGELKKVMEDFKLCKTDEEVIESSKFATEFGSWFSEHLSEADFVFN